MNIPGDPLAQALKHICDLIQKSESILLTTHKQCDGDGLGSEIALYYALKKIGKRVAIINVDGTPKKYHFLGTEKLVIEFDKNPMALTGYDLALIFDTNDERLLEPLFSQLVPKAQKIIFIDHHPLLKEGPQPSRESWIDITAASTGEMAYKLIEALKIPWDRQMAQAIYMSITFDTQLYKFIRASPNSHLIAAQMLLQDFDALEVHRQLFGNQTMNKMSFLAKALGDIEYFENGKIAALKLHSQDLKKFQLDMDDSRDVIDMIMTIETLEAAVIFREDAPLQFKISLRSKGELEVLSIAESLGGGGHVHASGAYVRGDYDGYKKQIVDSLRLQVG